MTASAVTQPMPSCSAESSALLMEITETQREIENLEDSKRALNERLYARVYDLGQASTDSQAHRAVILRFLYWETNVPPEVISEGFCLTRSRVHKLAGGKQVSYTCPTEGCTSVITSIATSRSFLREMKVAKYDKYLCPACLLKNKEDRDAFHRECQASAQRREELERRRNEELAELSWDDYIDTPDWKSRVGEMLWEDGFLCGTCKEKPKRLRVYPRQGVGQKIPGFGSGSDYHVVCKDCVSRIADLVDPERFDVYTTSDFEVFRDQRDDW